MADTKISALTAIASIAGEDLLAVVDDPAGTPATTKATVTQIRAYIIGLATTWTATQTITPAANTSALVSSGGSLTGANAQSLINLEQTWNTSGTPTLIKANITNTASNAASVLFDLQVGGTSRFRVDLTNGALVGQNNSGPLFHRSGNLWSVCNTNTSFPAVDLAGGAGTVIGSDLSYGWNSTTFTNSGSADLKLFRDAANNLAQRNGTAAQTFRVYRSFTDSSNYSRLALTWNTTTAVIHAQGAGTGADGNIAFNDAALATGATVGYIMIPSCAGAPTGVPADIPTGQVALHFDSTNNKLYVYDGAWLSTAALT
jgi:hypothetical protein